MDNYLAGIAARNNLSDDFAFMPLLSPPLGIRTNVPETNKVRDWVQPFDTSVPEEFGRREGEEWHENTAIYHDPPLQPQKNIMRTERGLEVQENEQRAQYISRYLERIFYHEKVIDKPSASQPQTNHSSEIPVDHQVFKPSDQHPLKNNIEQGTLHEGSRILPQITIPDGETQSQDPNTVSEALTARKPSPIIPGPDRGQIKTGPINPVIREIMPRIPDIAPLDKKRTTGELKSDSGPKLVIGKITVEILPPQASQPQKVITRVVEKPAEENQTKINRLQFGLGQL